MSWFMYLSLVAPRETITGGLAAAGPKIPPQGRTELYPGVLQDVQTAQRFQNFDL